MAALVLLAGTLCLPLAGCFDADYGTTEPPGYDLRVPLTAPRDADPVGFVEVNKRGETEQVEIIVGYAQPRPTGPYDVHLHRGTCEQPGRLVRSSITLLTVARARSCRSGTTTSSPTPTPSTSTHESGTAKERVRAQRSSMASSGDE